ncbi:hypothetical protein H2202_010964 [Exophiala xenobiotica]|nr:hypothetical protein H2202_010964 [Exophiala xenobiotica]KAK5312149.1 hypothetical protein LTR93_011437 [Exophiala xenobiotica]
MLYFMHSSITLFLLPGLVISNVTSNEIAYWDRPRAALIRDNVYIEGGWMQTGTWKDGGWDIDSLTTANSSNGMLFKPDMHSPFGISTGQSPAMFESIPEDGVQNYYIDGYMFADYNEFYAWGGITLTSANLGQRTVNLPLYNTSQATDIELGVPNLGYVPQNGSFITVTNGAGANAPSESSGFYFGGFYNQNGTTSSYFDQPTDQSRWLITAQMTELGHANWIKTPLDEGTAWRSEGGLVWVPTSTAGILIAIGGVLKPADMNFEIAQDNSTESITFLKEFPVYDIGTSTWSLQMLNEGSPIPETPLAQFCTVVASGPNGSHHEIFVYGGWDSNGGQALDTVWILTVPSFTWVKANNPGRTGSARQNHICVAPYPDQMVVIGGTGSSEAPPTYSSAVDIFNLNNFNWTGTYDPDIYADYTPHQDILDIISATPTAGNMPSEVASWFDNKYDMQKVKFYGPYRNDCTATPLGNMMQGE